MNEMFSQGGRGSTGILTNKQAVARKFGVKQSEVTYFSVGAALTGYRVLYDKISQRAYSLPTDIAVGSTAVSLSNTGILVHTNGTIDLGLLAQQRNEFVSAPGSFDSGATISTHNELLVYAGIQYYWEGALPKTVPSGATPYTSGGVEDGAWAIVGEPTVKHFMPEIYSDFSNTADPTKGDALIGVKQPLASAKARTLHEKLADTWWLTDFTGTWDGVADNTEDFQNVLNHISAEAVARTATLYIPNSCIVRILSRVTLPINVKICGDASIGIPGGYAAANVLTATPAIHVASTADLYSTGANTIEGLYFIRDGMVAPETSAANYAGTCIKLMETKDYLVIDNCLFVGFNRVLDATNCAFIRIKDVHWDCINGFYLTGSGSAPELINTRGWPWGTITAPGSVNTPDLNNHLYRAGTAYSFVNCAWPTVRNCHTYGHETGYFVDGGDTARFEFCSHEHHTVAGTIIANNGNSFLITGNVPQSLISNCITKHSKNNGFTVNTVDGCVTTIDNSRAVDYMACGFRNIGAGSMMLYNISTIGRGTDSGSIGVFSGATNRLTLVNGFYSVGDYRTIEANCANTVVENVYKQESSGGRAYVNTVVQHPVTAVTGTELDLRSHLDFYSVTGTATITNMKGTYIGHLVTLLCTNSVTFNNGSSGDGQIRSSGGSQVVGGNQVVQFVCVGTMGSSTWRQVAAPLSF